MPSQITSGESVEQIAYDVARYVYRHLSVSARDGLDYVKGSPDVIAINNVRFDDWLQKAITDVEEVIVARIREHIGPSVVRTLAELDELPVGSVVRESDTGPFLGIETVPGVFEKFPNGLGWFCVAGHGDRTAEIELPATVLHEPGGES